MVGFIVWMAGSAVSGGEILRMQAASLPAISIGQRVFDSCGKSFCFKAFSEKLHSGTNVCAHHIV